MIVTRTGALRSFLVYLDSTTGLGTRKRLIPRGGLDRRTTTPLLLADCLMIPPLTNDEVPLPLALAFSVSIAKLGKSGRVVLQLDCVI